MDKFKEKLEELEEYIADFLRSCNQSERDQLVKSLEKWKVRTLAVNALQEAKNEQETSYGAIKMDPDKYLALLKIIDDFCLRGKQEKVPQFMVIMGGIGVGKTTIRKAIYANDWVIADPNDIFQAVKRTIGPEGDIPYVYFAGVEIVRRAINERRNILIEVTGDKLEPLKKVLDGMEALGYKLDLKAIHNDIEKSWQNNLNRDKDNTSALYTQDEVYSWFNSILKEVKA